MKHPAFEITSQHEFAWIKCARLERLPWLIHAFGTRRENAIGVSSRGLDSGYSAGDGRANLSANVLQFFKSLGAERFSLASLRQIHSAKIYQVTRASSGELRYTPAAAASRLTIDDGRSPSGKESAIDNQQSFNPAGDALMTDDPGILLSIRTADCMPILLVDRRRRAVAAIHAGWRGALARIIEKTVDEMRRAFHSRPEDLFAAVGPSIRACCYEVGQEVADAFQERFGAREDFFAQPPPDDAGKALKRPNPSPFLIQAPPEHRRDSSLRLRLDLVAVARYELLQAGVAPSQIEVADYCTACHTDLFFSHRREGSRAGRMMAVIGIKA